MAAERYFLAVQLPRDHREQLAGLGAGESARGISWTRFEQLHLTVRFIGDLDPGAAEPLEEALRRLRVEPFILPLEGVGRFPPRGRPRVLWAGVGRGHPRLFQLRQRVDDTLLALGVEADLRQFHPHVTLARIREEASENAVNALVKRHRDFAGPPFRVEAFGLYVSRLEAGGARHTLRAEFRLRGS